MNELDISIHSRTDRPRRTALLQSPAFLGHDTGDHPENAGRLLAIEAELTRRDLRADRPDLPFSAASRSTIERIHDPAYVDLIHQLAGRGGGWLDADTIVQADSVAVAELAAGAAVAAVDAVLDGRIDRAFVLARPPGHHATPTRGMGFCLFNHVAVAAAQALAREMERVAILDWDVHHGNGTQDTFYATDRVLYCSLHQWPLYPGSGQEEDQGSGSGRGFTVNVPLAAGTDDASYLKAFDQRVAPAIDRYRPDLLLISAGFDAHFADPLASLQLTEMGFAALARRAIDLADAHANGRIVALLEGGYDPPALGRSVATVLEQLDERTADEQAAAPRDQGTAQEKESKAGR